MEGWRQNSVEERFLWQRLPFCARTLEVATSGTCTLTDAPASWPAWVSVLARLGNC